MIAAAPASADLLDVSEGATVTDHSSLLAGEVAAEMLGFTPDTGPEIGSLIFLDNLPKGTVHFVEWEMPDDVRLGYVRLHAGADACTSAHRTFDRFRLLADLGDGLQPIVDEQVAVPYQYLNPCTFLLAMSTPVVNASRFRAEFTQFQASGWEGPRVIELDGYPPALCGDATFDEAVSATDALSTLKSSVGSSFCELCICDVTTDASVTATDALAILRHSVGQDVQLVCPDCPVSELPENGAD